MVSKAENVLKSILISQVPILRPLNMIHVLQISYSLVVILELNGVSEVQYKEIIIIGNKQY